MCNNKGQNEKICDGEPLYEDCNNEQLWNVAAFLLCAAHAMLGLGGSLYWTCGAAYLDDNVRKNSVPVLLGKFFLEQEARKIFFCHLEVHYPTEVTRSALIQKMSLR